MTYWDFLKCMPLIVSTPLTFINLSMKKYAISIAIGEDVAEEYERDIIAATEKLRRAIEERTPGGDDK